MNLDHLRTFVTAAELSSFTQAARRVHLTQSAVSQQMRELENRLGVSLFERRGRSLLLSPAGECLRPLALRVLGAYKDLENELSLFKGIPQGVIQLGASSTPGIYLLPYVLDAYARRLPGVKVSLQILEDEALSQSLRTGDLDLAVTEAEIPPGELPGWERVPLLEDELVLVVPRDHRWATLQEVELSELVGEPFILRPRNSAIRQLHSNLFAAKGFDPDRLVCRFELGSTEGIKHAVLAGLGVGFVFRSAIGSELAAGTLSEVRIRGLTIGRTQWLLRPAKSKLPPHHQQLIDLLCTRDWLPDVLQQRLHAERTVQIVEIRITRPQAAGKAIQALQLPRNCLVALLKRKGLVSVPDGQTVLELGDTVTLIGIHDVVEQARRCLERE